MKFVDHATITVRSGNGGAGAVAFRREKYEPRGGPSGGDGGEGGSVTLVADPQLYTLLDLRYNRHHFAGNGSPGGSSNKKGRDGEDIVIRVPVGTTARLRETGEMVGELVEAGQRLVLAQGGRGGKGNTFFATPTRRAPKFAQPGEPGEEKEILLELKLLADVGLVGLPNAGKSTLIASMSAAQPKIADYPFTTLVPALGVVYVGEFQSFVMADLPGIIEGASEGKGLGARFLKHIERNAMLLIVIPVTTEDFAAEYETLLNELREFNPELVEKPRMTALSKMDLVSGDEAEKALAKARKALPAGEELFPISAVARLGLEPLKWRLWEMVQASPGDDADA